MNWLYLGQNMLMNVDVVQSDVSSAVSQRVELRLNIAQDRLERIADASISKDDWFLLATSSSSLEMRLAHLKLTASRLPRYVRHAGFYHRLLHHPW